MWRSFAALLLLVTPALAQENATAYEALRVVGRQFGRGALNHIVSITGVRGEPQPEKWKIILENPGARGGVREVEIADGRISSDRPPADKSNTRFETADYTLRTDERGEPIWIVTLLNKSSRPVGTIYIGATRGVVRRTEGMFAGATMEDVENDYDKEDEGGIINSVKSRISHAFHRTQEEARGMFERVKRSFSDFINRE